jgi:hypothetical protein
MEEARMYVHAWVCKGGKVRMMPMPASTTMLQAFSSMPAECRLYVIQRVNEEIFYILDRKYLIVSRGTYEVLNWRDLMQFSTLDAAVAAAVMTYPQS